MSCGTSKDVDNVAGCLEIAARSLPEGYELYDFGGGMTIAPCPDLGDPGQGAGYLTSHLAAIWKVRKTESDPVRLTWFKIDLQFVTAQQIVDRMQKAIEHNKIQTVENEEAK